MNQPTLGDLLERGSDGVQAGDLATSAVAEAARRIRRRRVAGTAVVAVTAVAVVAAALVHPMLTSNTLAPDVTAPNGTATALDPSRPSADGLVGGWEILGEPQWVLLRNNYFAATFFAVNRTTRDLLPDRGLAVRAEFLDSLHVFLADCAVDEFTGGRPTTRAELSSKRVTPRATPVHPGEKVFFTCYPIVGERPEGGRIDASSVTFATDLGELS